MKNFGYKNLINVLLICVLLYIVFYLVFFFVLGNNSVELVIAFCFIFLICLIYLYLSNSINLYFVNISKIIWLHFCNLNILLKLSKDLIINLNNMYLSFLEYKLYVLYNVDYSLGFIFSDIIVYLSEKLFINNVMKILWNKLLIENLSIKILNSIIILNIVNIPINLFNINVFFILLKKNG